jgi:O-succinylbenzoic acid--CoA ligase
MSKPNLFEIYAAYGDAVALHDIASGRIVRHSELLSYHEQQARGVAFGGSVATCRRPDFDHAVFLLAMLAQGRQVVPISPRLPAEEVARRAAFAGVSGILTDRGFEKIEATISQNKPCGSVLFTSGSSGSTRAIVHDLSAHIANAEGAATRIPIEPGCGWMLSLPLHHVSGFSVLIRCLLSGATVVFPDPSLPLDQQISNPLVTHVSVVSLQLQRLLEAKAPIHRLRAVLGGGGPFPSNLVAKAVHVGTPLHLTYGMTETASQITTTERLHEVTHLLHAGSPLPGREVKISDSGEILVRGDFLASGILAADRSIVPLTDSEGFFATRDIGQITPEGNLVILGRRDRMIISGGENIHPEMIESLLSEALGVQRAVVVGIPHEEYGQRPVAYVAGDVDAEKLRNYLASRLERFAIPDAFLHWPEGIPTNEGKIDFTRFG